MATNDKIVIEKKGDSQGNCRVGDVEYIPMISERMKIQKVDDGVIGEPVITIA